MLYVVITRLEILIMRVGLMFMKSTATMQEKSLEIFTSVVLVDFPGQEPDFARTERYLPLTAGRRKKSIASPCCFRYG
jgi:hypothetical protein